MGAPREYGARTGVGVRRGEPGAGRPAIESRSPRAGLATAVRTLSVPSVSVRNADAGVFEAGNSNVWMEYVNCT